MLILLLIWCFSIGISVIAILDVEYRYKTEKRIWVCEYIMSKTSYIYNVTVYFFVTFIPIISLITIYIRAAKALAIHGLDSNNFAVKRRNAMNKKVVKLFTVIVVHICCIEYTLLSIYFCFLYLPLLWHHQNCIRIENWWNDTIYNDPSYYLELLRKSSDILQDAQRYIQIRN